MAAIDEFTETVQSVSAPASMFVQAAKKCCGDRGGQDNGANGYNICCISQCLLFPYCKILLLLFDPSLQCSIFGYCLYFFAMEKLSFNIISFDNTLA
ncbi:Peroxisomal membrane protein [Dirofilaria immitis]